MARTSGAQVVTSSPRSRSDPAGDLVGGVAEQGVCQGGLARAVRPHQGVQLSFADDQVDAPKNLDSAHGDVQVIDLEERSHGQAVYPLVEVFALRR